MSWPSIVIYGVVMCVGLPAAFRNPTAFALVASWLAGELTWMATGDSLPLSTYLMCDVAVIAFIYAKAIRDCGPKQYPTLRAQLRCLVTDLTICDRWVVAIFLLGMWPAYVVSIHPYYKWFWLWGLTIAQFLLAGGEALAIFLKARREALRPTPIIDRHLKVVPFPVQRRSAEAVRKTPEGGLLIVKARGYG